MTDSSDDYVPNPVNDIEDYFDSDSPTSPNEPEEMILKTIAMES